ncbi:hypothetical protein [Nocardia sp. NBC_01009]|uniref:hypothetical protein n=1 Tax=Nocardia sp. NBC_01009 TaxID=2975996 RepID=UPI00386F40DA|nr:hypothetical protein OHA42_19115 [Nocardia sp. NBC_01009]
MGVRRWGLGLLVAAGLLNVVPMLGAVSTQWARSAYGIDAVSSDVEVLLRHRGVLFGIVGVGLLVAAFRPHLRNAAVTANATSFAGFIILVLAQPSGNSSLVRIAWFDVAGLIALAVGFALVTRKASDPASIRVAAS